MDNKKIYIIGAGAIGKALAVFLQSENRDVALIRGREDNIPAKVELITVTNGENQTFQQQITTTTFSNLSAIDGIVLVTTKAFANEMLAAKLKNKKGRFSIVLLQNGLNVEKPFEDFDQLYRCVLFSTSQIVSTNQVSFKSVTASPVGIINGKETVLNSIVGQISTVHFAFRSEFNIVKYVWDKAIINCAFNSICPLLEVDNGIFHTNPEALELAESIIGECVALADKLGIVVHSGEIKEKLLQISQRAEGQLISTYEDIRNNRRTEIESLNLEMARLADEAGVPGLVTNTRLLGEMIRIKSKIRIEQIKTI
ncbi:ketopantoate reductase family protein [Prolixibacter sp. NT017]|uniref:ketopantoate reductase family protein n=1 Tax=Prolixibacter sp. NT017 TaxID=2652390 RepID=UPI00126E05CD|nr:2-dehydropantoate 2-reductase [Prolixibacter sp. NT017]GET25554.1 2-dehydropantoate 2-reductase [Prolixibacter sp. NT017]